MGKPSVPLDEATFWNRHYLWIEKQLINARAVVTGLERELDIAVDRLAEIGCPNPKALCRLCGHRAEVHLTEYGIDRGCFILNCPCVQFMNADVADDAANERLPRPNTETASIQQPKREESIPRIIP
jgi:hypothetical protein